MALINCPECKKEVSDTLKKYNEMEASATEYIVRCRHMIYLEDVGKNYKLCS